MASFRSGWSRQVLVSSAFVAIVAALIASAWVAAPTAAQGPISGFVTRSGDRLLVDGAPYRFSGANIYNATSDGWCSFDHTDQELRDAFAAIAAAADASAYPGGGAVVRTWFFQSLAASKDAGQDHRWSGARIWDRFDRVLAIAAEEGVRVIPVLGNQWGECGDMVPDRANYRDAAWYGSGYTVPDPIQLQSPPNPSGTGYLRGYDHWVSYRDWVAEVVTRYADREVILAWQLMNEAEVWYPDGCPRDTDAPMQLIKDFAADISGHIRSIETNHLISLGTMGGGQCGAQGGQYQTLHELPDIDLCEYHDYSQAAMPGDQWNGLAVRIAQCAALNKPLFVGEVGLWLHDVPGGTLQARAGLLRAKLDAQVSAGIVGHLAWNHNQRLVGAPVGDAAFDFGPGDPMLLELARARVLPPGAPTDPVLTPGDSTVCATWTPPAADGGSPVIGYRMSASPGTSQRWTRGPSGCLTELANGTPHDIEITPVTAPGLGHDLAGPALSVQATPVDGPLAIEVQPPSLRLGDIGTTTTNTIVVANTGLDELANVIVTTDPPLDGLTCDVEQPAVLAAGASFSCTGDHTVSAADIAAGSVIHTGCAQAAGAALTCDTVEVGLLPNAVTNVTARNGWDATLVTWDPPLAERRAPVTGYMVTVWSTGPAPSPAPEPAPVAVVSVAATETSAVVHGLVVGETYLVEVTAENTFGSSDVSSSVHEVQQAPTLAASESPVDLGLCLPAITCTRSVSISNVGWAPVTFGTVEVDGPAFTRRASETCTGATLAEGQSCRVDLDFRAVGVGQYGSLLQIPSDAPDGTIQIPLTATVVDPDHASGTLMPGESLSTGGGADPTADDPVTTSVTVSDARVVTIAESDSLVLDDTFAPIGQRVWISAQHGATFTFVFRVHGASPDTVILRDGGILVHDCTGEVPRPSHENPCVVSRLAGPGHAILTLEGTYATGFSFALPFDVDVSAFPPSLPAEGETVTVEAVVRNVGTATLEGVDVTMDLDLAGWSCAPLPPVSELEDWATITCAGTHLVTAADLAAGSIAGDVCAATAEAASLPVCDAVEVTQYVPGSVHLSPPWHDFGSHPLGSGTSQALVITNDGETPVTVVANDWTGEPSTYWLWHECLNVEIPPGGSCTMTAYFTARYLTTLGSRVDVTVDDGSGPSVVSAFLRGTGTGSALIPTERHTGYWLEEAEFRLQDVLSPGTTIEVLSVEIIGPDAAAWPIATNDCTGVVDHFCRIITTFTPSDETPKSATLVVTTTAGTFTAALDGELPPGSLGPRVVIFGEDLVSREDPVNDRIDIVDVPPSGSGQAELGLQSIGTHDLTVDSIGFEGGDAAVFGIEEDCTGGPRAPYARCSITITATPTQPGELTSTLVIHSDSVVDPTIEIDVSVNRPLEPADIVVSPSDIDYGPRAVRSADYERRITVTNNGPVPVTIASLDGQVYGSSLYVSPWDCIGRTLPPGGACESTVWFYPNLLGAYAASPTFTVVGPNGFEVVRTVELSGEAVGHPIDPRPVAFDRPKEIGLGFFNILSTDPVLVHSVAFTGDDAADFVLSIDQCTGVQVGSTGACGFNILFRPLSGGSREAQVVVTTSAGTFSADLSGQAPADWDPDHVSAEVGFGLTLSTGAGGPATPRDAMVVSVTTRTGGTVTITETPDPSLPPPTGYTLFGTVALISAPDESVGQPMLITMRADASVVPAGVDETNVVMFRDGVSIARCADPDTWTAVPDPCIQESLLLPDGDLQVMALTTEASEWAVGHVPQVSAPEQVDFGGWGVDHWDIARVDLYNRGPSDVSIGTPTFSGPDADRFTVSLVDCPVALAEGASCIVWVEFRPDAERTFDATIDIPTDVAGVVSVPLTGTGITPPLALSETFIDFGRVDHQQAHTRTVTVTNTSGQTIPGLSVSFPTVSVPGWSAPNDCWQPIAAGATCTIDLTLTPQAVGPTSRDVELNLPWENHGYRWTFEAIAQVGLPVIPATQTFGLGDIWSLAWMNVEPEPWTIDTVSLIGPDADRWELQNDNCIGMTLTTGQQCWLNARYLPASGPAPDHEVRTAQVRVGNAERSYTIDLVGQWPAPPAGALSIAPSLQAFGQVEMGASAVRTFTVTNTHTDRVAIMVTDLVFQPSDLGFELIANDCGATIGAGGACTFVVRFTPRSTSAVSTEMAIPWDLGTSTLVGTLTGTGTMPPDPDSVSGDPGAGGTISTGGGGEPTSADPTTVSVTTPTGGTVSIVESAVAGDPPPSGYTLFGTVARITAPDGLPGQPLRITMRVDASVVPAGVDETTMVMFRNGVPIARCASPGAGTADPDPCIWEALVLGDGDLQVTALTSQASEWALGYAGSSGPAITIRPHDRGSFDSLGDRMDLFFSVTNVGSVTLHQLTPRLGSREPTCMMEDGEDWDSTPLPPGQEITCRIRYTVTEAHLAAGVIGGDICVTSDELAQVCQDFEIRETPFETHLSLADAQQYAGSTFDVSIVIDNDGSEPLTIAGVFGGLSGSGLGQPACAALGESVLEADDGSDPGGEDQAGCSWAEVPDSDEHPFIAIVGAIGPDGYEYTDDAEVAFELLPAPEPLLELSPAVRDFGSVEVGRSSDRSFTVTNIGDADLNVSAVALAGANPGQFSILDEDCSGPPIAPDATCTIEVRFEPGSTGAKTARLEVTSDSDGSPHPATLDGNAYADAASGDPGPGGTVATSGGDPTPDDPVTTAVTTPAGGTVSIEETDEPGFPPPSGYASVGQVSVISAPDGTLEAPLRIVFRIDASLLPPGVDETNLAVFRNGVLVDACDEPELGWADPDPCLMEVVTLGDGDLEVTVLTIQASEWSLGYTLRAQAITFPKVPVQSVGDPPVQLLATADSGLPVSYTVESGACTLDGDMLTAGPVGECVVVASQPGDTVFAPAPDKRRTVRIELRVQAITFPKVPVQSLGDPPVQLLATADSGLPVSYTVESGACTVEGDLLTAGPVGECVVVASQPGDAMFAPANDKRRTVRVELRTQSISFPPPGGLRVGEAVELTATADSGLTVSYAVIGPCTLTGSTLRGDAAGECVVTASQVGDGTYAPAKDRTRTVRVTLRPQSITFPSPGGLQVGTTVALSATAESGLAVAYSVSGPCSLTGVTLTADAHGDCVVVASQAGDATWAPAGDKTRTVKVSRHPQSISFPKVPVQRVGDPPVQLLAVADSGLPVSYTVESGACTVDGDLLTVGPAGECVVVASQPGDTTYAPATDKRRTVQVR